MSGYGTANTWSTGPTNPPSWAPKQPTQQQLDMLYRYPAGPPRDNVAKAMGITNYNRYGGYNKKIKRTNKRRKSRRMKSRRRN
jgi:hypothetical protein